MYSVTPVTEVKIALSLSKNAKKYHLNSYPNPLSWVSRLSGASVAVTLPSSFGEIGECLARYSSIT